MNWDENSKCWVQLIPTDPLSLADLVEDQSTSLPRHFLDHGKAFRFSDISFKLLVSCKNIAHSSAYSLHNAIIGHWHLLYAQRLSVGLKRVPCCFHSSNSHVEILDDPWWSLMSFAYEGYHLNLWEKSPTLQRSLHSSTKSPSPNCAQEQ